MTPVASLASFLEKNPVPSKEINTLFFHLHVVLHYFLALLHCHSMTALALFHMLNNRAQKYEEMASTGM